MSDESIPHIVRQFSGNSRVWPKTLAARTEICSWCILGLNGEIRVRAVGKARHQFLDWVGREILPHERDLRAWLRRSLNPDDLDDVIQESYCKIAAVDDFRQIRSGRAYLFTTARRVVLMRIRRARVVKIETVAEIETLKTAGDEFSPERITAGRNELSRVSELIASLPERCRRVIELRKIDGLSQREVAERMGLPEHIVENDVVKGLKLILKQLAEGDRSAELALTEMGSHERTRDIKGD